MPSQAQHDQEDHRRLTLIIGVIVVTAAAVCALSLVGAFSDPPATVNEVATVVALISMIAVATMVKARVRIRSTTHSITWNEAAIVVGVAVAPASWVVLCTATGVAVAFAVLRLPAIKMAFSIGKNALVAAGAGLTLVALDWAWPPRDSSTLSAR